MYGSWGKDGVRPESDKGPSACGSRPKRWVLQNRPRLSAARRIDFFVSCSRRPPLTSALPGNSERNAQLSWAQQLSHDAGHSPAPPDALASVAPMGLEAHTSSASDSWDNPMEDTVVRPVATAHQPQLTGVGAGGGGGGGAGEVAGDEPQEEAAYRANAGVPHRRVGAAPPDPRLGQGECASLPVSTEEPVNLDISGLAGPVQLGLFLLFRHGSLRV
jgi:hypothetical protein